MKKKAWTSILIAFITLIIFSYVNNSSLFAESREGAPFLLAHRGLGQTFSMEGIEADTCTAERIFIPEHEYLENTLSSFQAAFDAGAHMIELDVRPTKDDQFAVFHDWTLDCRTDVNGMPSDYTMEELRQVDIGYGYTADDGQTYPFRGQGIGQMPSLANVFESFSGKALLIHIKSNDREEGGLMATHLKQLPKEQRNLITVYGGDEPIAALQEQLPELRVMSKQTLKDCLLPYVGFGWSGYVPPTCEGTHLHIPESIAPWLWGWPTTFLNRMEDVDTRVILVAGDGGWSEGFDELEDLQRLPHSYTGGIWTNRIDRIGAVLHTN